MFSETLDKAYLEYSNLTQARTRREIVTRIYMQDKICKSYKVLNLENLRMTPEYKYLKDDIGEHELAIWLNEEGFIQ